MMRVIDNNEMHSWFDFSIIFHRTVQVLKIARMGTARLRDDSNWSKGKLYNKHNRLYLLLYYKH